MTKGYDEKRTPEQIAEEKARHESLKKKLKIGGTAALAVGLVCTIVAFVNFFTVFGNPDAGMPKLFFLGFIGLPLIAIGAITLRLYAVTARRNARIVTLQTTQIANFAKAAATLLP